MAKNKKLKKLAKANIKILKSGKIKFAKGQKIDLRMFAEESIEGAVVSRLDGIISKEDVVIDTEDLRVDVLTTMQTDIRTAEIDARVSKAGNNLVCTSEECIKNAANNNHVKTIVLVVNKKEAVEGFDFLNNGTLGVILRSSTLASAYTDESIKDKWVELNKDDSSSFTNVLYIPKVMMFVDLTTNEFRKHPYYINVLILAVPSVKKMSDGVNAVSDADASARVIADICDAAIRCGCKDLIINPYGCKIAMKDPSITAQLWNEILTSERFIVNLYSVNFAIENENLFIVFNSARTTK